MNLKSYFAKWWCNLEYNEALQILVAFSLGLVFSPFTYSLPVFFLFIAVYEIFFGYVVGWQMPYWRQLGRFGIFFTSLAGWILGRIVASRPLR